MNRTDIIIKNFYLHQRESETGGSYHGYTCQCEFPEICVSTIEQSSKPHDELCVYMVCPNDKCEYIKELDDAWIYEEDMRALREYNINQLLNE